MFPVKDQQPRFQCLWLTRCLMLDLMGLVNVFLVTNIRNRRISQNASESLLGIDDTPDRIDNISDTALRTFREHYNDDTITKDVIFDYVYGILHAPSYCEQFANDLSKMIPRIPFAPDFHAFAEAGKKLAELHLNYETCEQYPLSVEFPNISAPPTDLEDADPNLFLLTEKSDAFWRY